MTAASIMVGGNPAAPRGGGGGHHHPQAADRPSHLRTNTGFNTWKHYNYLYASTKSFHCYIYHRLTETTDDLYIMERFVCPQKDLSAFSRL